jgi:large subunit ribosomal protein L28e
MKTSQAPNARCWPPEQAIGVIPGKDGGVTLLIKKSDKHHQPAQSTQTTTFGPSRSTRKYVSPSSKTHLNASNQHAPSTKHTLTMHRTYTAIVNSTTKRNYRPDLRQDAVARASAIRKSQRAVKKADKPTKTRGAKAQKAAAASA